MPGYSMYTQTGPDQQNVHSTAENAAATDAPGVANRHYPTIANRAYALILDGKRITAIDTAGQPLADMMNQLWASWGNRLSAIKPIRRR